MNYGKTALYIRKLKLGVQNLHLKERYHKVEEFYQKIKVKRKNIFTLDKHDRVQRSERIKRDSFVRTIFEIFGFTAVMSITVLFCMVLLTLSFVMNTFLGAVSEYGWLILSLGLLFLGIGWYKPYKILRSLLILCGAFLFVLPFGPQVIEWYTGKDVLDLHWKNSYWLTLKASLVFLCYEIGSTSFILWVYLVSKGQRQNPFRRFQMLTIKRGLKQLKKLYTN